MVFNYKKFQIKFQIKLLQSPLLNIAILWEYLQCKYVIGLIGLIGVKMDSIFYRIYFSKYKTQQLTQLTQLTQLLLNY